MRILRLGILIGLFLSFSSLAYADYAESFGDLSLRDAELKESFRATGNIAALVDGVGLIKNGKRKTGNIKVKGVPDGAEVKQAWFYWMGFTKHVSESELGTIVFDGKIINAKTDLPAELVGEEDPEGVAPKRQVYKVDVSSLLDEGVNGVYKVQTLHKAKDTFGGALILIYEHEDLDESTVVLQDGAVLLSNEHSKKVVNGSAYDAVFNNMSDVDLSNSTLKVGISSGLSRDKHEIEIAGQRLKNVTKNSQGKAMDLINLDLSKYFSDEVVETLRYKITNSNKRGYFSQLFFNVLQTKPTDVDLSTSTLEVSKSSGRPGEVVDYSASLVNSAGASANDFVFEVDIPEDAEYVSGSLQLNGFSQTDSEDLDEAHFDREKGAVVVTPNVLGGGASMEVAFKARIAKGVVHEDSTVQTQGEIVVSGQQFLTDGDGDPVDGVDSETVVAVRGGKILNLPEGFNVYLKEFPSIDPRQIEKTGIHTVVFEVDSVPVAEINLDLDNDLAIDTINAAAFQFADKAFFHGFQGMPGVVDESYTLLIPWNGTAQVRLCLGALTIDHVHEGCGDSYEEVYDELLLNPGETQNGITCNISDGYWRCDGVTGSGGQGEGEAGGVPEFSDYLYLLVLAACFWMMQNKTGFNLGLQHRNLTSL